MALPARAHANFDSRADGQRVPFDRIQGRSRVAATLQARHRALGGPHPHCDSMASLRAGGADAFDMGYLPASVVHLNANCHLRTRRSVAWMTWACLLPQAQVKKPVAPTSDWANRVHSFRGRDCSSKSLEVDPGHTLARHIRAQDSHSSHRGEGEGDRRCRLASSLTDRGRGFATETQTRGKGRQPANFGRNALRSIAVIWSMRRVSIILLRRPQ
jgi:hypothetical protein